MRITALRGFADIFLLPSEPGAHTEGVGISVKITLEHVYISSKIDSVYTGLEILPESTNALQSQ